MTKTVSLETAKLLKEAGWVQDDKTDYHYYQQVGGIVVDTEVRGQWIVRSKKELALGFGDYVAAPDVSELLEALPKDIEYGTGYWNKGTLTLQYRGNYPDIYPKPWGCGYECGPEGEWIGHDDGTNLEGSGDTPAEALASLYMELKKQKLV